MTSSLLLAPSDEPNCQVKRSMRQGTEDSLSATASEKLNPTSNHFCELRNRFCPSYISGKTANTADTKGNLVRALELSCAQIVDSKTRRNNKFCCFKL